MTTRTKQLLLLLVAALLGLLWSQTREEDAPAPRTRRTAQAGAERSRTGAARPSRRGAAEPAPLTEVVELHLADLEPAGSEYRVGRNPFDFLAPPPPPPPPPPKGPSPAELAAQRAAAEAARQAAILATQNAEPPAPKPPPITFRYLGSFGPPARRIAVLSDGEATYNAMVGDVIEGKFRLVAIGYESVDIGFVDFPNLPPEQLPVGEEGS